MNDLNMLLSCFREKMPARCRQSALDLLSGYGKARALSLKNAAPSRSWHESKIFYFMSHRSQLGVQQAVPRFPLFHSLKKSSPFPFSAPAASLLPLSGVIRNGLL